MPAKILENFDFQFLYEQFDTNLFLTQQAFAVLCLKVSVSHYTSRTILLLISDHDASGSQIASVNLKQILNLISRLFLL